MILGITGHKGILGKSIINYIKKYEKSNYKISLYKNNVLDFEKLEKWIEKIDIILHLAAVTSIYDCLLYTSPSPRDLSTSRMPSSA